MDGAPGQGATAQKTTRPAPMFWIILEQLTNGNRLQCVGQRNRLSNHFFARVLSHADVPRRSLAPHACENRVSLAGVDSIRNSYHQLHMISAIPQTINQE